ncbi:MAG: YqgE/AlgH family protein [Myxococcota bacterium]
MASTDLAPGFLVAAPALDCPFFRRTVVLLVEHNEEGSFGFVVNRETDVRFRQVLGEVGIEIDAAVPPEAPVMVGGPVSPETGWILFDPHSGEGGDGEVFHLTDRLAVSASLGTLEKLAAGEGPRRCIMLLGYAGWGSGQLEREMRDGAWIPVDLDPALVFDAPVDQRWSRALAALGIDPARVSGSGVASA